jgi:hypothetical protein
MTINYLPKFKYDTGDTFITKTKAKIVVIEKKYFYALSPGEPGRYKVLIGKSVEEVPEQFLDKCKKQGDKRE